MKRFWDKVQRGNSCWLWIGCKNRYGRFCFNGKTEQAHRVAWMLTSGAIPVGLSVLHSCDNGHCINPGHLFLGTQLDNIRDMVNKGRSHESRGKGHIYTRGEKNGRARLSNIVVKAIRNARAQGISGKIIARALGVAPQTVYATAKQNWRHVL